MSKSDMEIARRLPAVMDKIEKLIERELGASHLVGLVVQRWGQGEKAELHYISNAPREFMHGAFRHLVEKWDAGAPDVPIHKRQ